MLMVWGAYGPEALKQTTGLLGNIQQLQGTPGMPVLSLQPGSMVTDRYAGSFLNLFEFRSLTEMFSGEPMLLSLHIVYQPRVPPFPSRFLFL